MCMNKDHAVYSILYLTLACCQLLNIPKYGDKIFQDLAMDPQILRVVAGLTMNSPRLFLYNFTMMTKDDQAKGSFHRDDSGFKFPPDFRNPHNDYQAGNGEIYCSHIATWVALVDVPGNTGFCVVPGSHKSSFQRPKTYRSNMIHQHRLRSPFKQAT